MTTFGYENPTCTWPLAGADVTGTGTLSVSVDTTHPDAGDHRATKMVNIRYELSGPTLVVTNDPDDGNYSYDVLGVAAESPKGSKRTTRTMESSGCMDGQTLLWEDAYDKARDTCKAKMKAYGTRMVEHILREIDKGDPPPSWVDPALAQGLYEVGSLYITSGVGHDGPSR